MFINQKETSGCFASKGFTWVVFNLWVLFFFKLASVSAQNPLVYTGGRFPWRLSSGLVLGYVQPRGDWARLGADLVSGAGNAGSGLCFGLVLSQRPVRTRSWYLWQGELLGLRAGFPSLNDSIISARPWHLMGFSLGPQLILGRRSWRFDAGLGLGLLFYQGWNASLGFVGQDGLWWEQTWRFAWRGALQYRFRGRLAYVLSKRHALGLAWSWASAPQARRFGWVEERRFSAPNGNELSSEQARVLHPSPISFSLWALSWEYRFYQQMRKPKDFLKDIRY